MFEIDSVVHRAAHLVDVEFAAEMRIVAIDARKKLAKLQSAVASNSGDRIRRAQRDLFRSFSLKLSCVVLSADKKDGEVTRSSLYEMAGEIDPFQDPNEPVFGYPKFKSERGNWRPILVFGPRRKALQTLVRLVLSAKFNFCPFDFMAPKRGAEVAADRITQFIDDGINHFVVADIEACFRSVKQEGVAEQLGIPPAVVRHCLLSGGDTLLLPSGLPYYISHTAFSEAVRQGLPQGARSSNLVVSLLLGPELWSLTSGTDVVLYGDDIAIPAATHDEAETLAKTLSDCLGNHPSGPFRLKRCEVVDARKGFNFLKYKFRRDRFTKHAKLHPSDLSYHRFAERVRGRVKSELLKDVYPTVITYRRNWLGSFRRYHPCEHALTLLGQSAITALPPHWLKRWDASCQAYDEAGKPPLTDTDDWLDLGLARSRCGPAAK